MKCSKDRIVGNAQISVLCKTTAVIPLNDRE